MKINITIGKPDFDKNPQKSTTNNHDWRVCAIVQFENQTFKWIPTYKQLCEIYQKLDEAEKMNRDIYKKVLQESGNRTSTI